VSQAGISCDACHAMSSLLEPVNGHAVLTPDGVRRGPIRDPVPTSAHASAFSALHEDSAVCGVCHAVTNSKHARIEETYGEWLGSTFSQPGGKTCQGCHMPTAQDPAATGGPTRTLHRHTFVGVDVSLVEPDAFPGYTQSRELGQHLLEQSCEVSLRADPRHHQLQVWLHNLAGHALPSGASAERQLARSAGARRRGPGGARDGHPRRARRSS
jgi:hypothetical protein